jgi:phosphopantothenoylcysteine synthetase/decarboxylase
MVVGNYQSEKTGLESDLNQVLILDKKGETLKSDLMSKYDIARIIFEKVMSSLNL